ncbi:MAG: GNAT family N-acetyltransferase [Neptuniibacter sp.]
MNYSEQMSLIFRTFKTDDLPALIPLMEQLGYIHSEHSLLGNIQALRNSGGEVFVAERNNKVLGCAAAIVDVRLAEGIQGEIVSLVVLEEMRGFGLGKGLVNAAEEWLFQYADTVRVRANEIRAEARQFYLGMGYEVSKIQVVLTKKAMP